MDRLKKDKGGASLSLNKLILLILAALVVIGAFIIISVYGREILDWFKNQPEYPGGEDEVVEGADELIYRNEEVKPEKKQEIKDFDSAMLRLNELIKSYGKNARYSSNEEIKNFVDEIYRLGLITKEELDEIDGMWGLGEESLDYVKRILEKQEKVEEENSESLKAESYKFPNIKRFTYNKKAYYIDIDDFIKKKNSFNAPDRFSLYEDIHEKEGKLNEFFFFIKSSISI
jgi:hypothetical protein